MAETWGQKDGWGVTFLPQLALRVKKEQRVAETDLQGQRDSVTGSHESHQLSQAMWPGSVYGAAIFAAKSGAKATKCLQFRV